MPVLLRRRRGAYEGPSCPDCRRVLLDSRLVSGTQTCPHCGMSFQSTAFQPPERPVRVLQTAEAGPGGTVSCARHERNVAVATCGRCGLFICALCRISADGKVYCPACFDRLSAEGALESTRTSFRDYGGSARMACLVGFFFWFFAVVLGAVALYYSIKGIQQKRQFEESDGLAGLYITLGIGIVETIGGGLLLAAVFGAFR